MSIARAAIDSAATPLLGGTNAADGRDSTAAAATGSAELVRLLSMEAAHVRAPQATDRQFLGQLYAEFSGRVYGFLLSRCGSRALAEDLTGDTFVDAARAVARGDGDQVDGSWLITVARRRIIDHWRRMSTYEGKLDMMRSRRLSEEIDLRDDDHERVVAALESLPTRQRAALALRHLEGYSLSEVAEVLDISYRAAESLVARARHSFAAAYTAEEES